MRISNRQREARRGVAATEFAIVLPVLATIALGCVDFGRFAYTHMAVTSAARAGAGYGSTHAFDAASQATWQANIRQAVIDEMSQVSGFDGSKLIMPSPVVTSESSGFQRVSVDVGYPFQTVVTWPGIPKNITLRRVVVMRIIRT